MLASAKFSSAAFNPDLLMLGMFVLNLSILAHHGCNSMADRYLLLFGGCRISFLSFWTILALDAPPVNLILGGGEAGCHRVVKIPALSDSDQYTGPEQVHKWIYPNQLTIRAN